MPNFRKVAQLYRELADELGRVWTSMILTTLLSLVTFRLTRRMTRGLTTL